MTPQPALSKHQNVGFSEMMISELKKNKKTSSEPY